MQLILIWLAILVAVAHAAMFSGLNLAVFSLSRLRLEIEASTGNASAATVRELRRNSNFTLATILWGGVATDVLITLLSKSVLSGILAFVTSEPAREPSLPAACASADGAGRCRGP